MGAAASTSGLYSWSRRSPGRPTPPAGNEADGGKARRREEEVNGKRRKLDRRIENQSKKLHVGLRCGALSNRHQMYVLKPR